MYIYSQVNETNTDITQSLSQYNNLNSSFIVDNQNATEGAELTIDKNTNTVAFLEKNDIETPPTDTSLSPDDSPIEAVNTQEDDNTLPHSNIFSLTLFENIFPSNDSDIFKQNGSYGWVLVLEGFLSSVMTDGSLYAFGVFFPSYVSEFNSTFATASWIGSVASGVTVLFAFHVGYLCDRFGYRLVMIIGALCSGIAYVAASYSTAIWQLILSQGILFGIGCSLAYTSGLAIVGQWFTVNRGLAFGVAGSGSGTGQFILALLTGYFLESFGWRVALQYLAIIVTGTLLFCALIMRNITRERNAPVPRPIP